MEKEEIKKMFQANATLRHCSAVDPQRPILEETLEKLSRQYFAECLDGELPLEDGPQEMNIQEALNVLIDTCQAATVLEATHHPNGMTDDQVKGLVSIRQSALDTVIANIMEQNN